MTNPPGDPASAARARDTVDRVCEGVGRVLSGQETSLRWLLAALASGGHILIEDFPGTGKTTMAKAIARAIGAQFKRIQFTPDLLPADILGVSVFNPGTQSFDFHRGPVFTQILLADEINRASPRTQSALLEAMAEHQVSIDGTTHRLEDFFFVIATQNPVEFRGTYPLPESQLDRFAIRLELGYVSPEQEVEVLRSQEHGHPLESLASCASVDDVLALREAVRQISVSADVRRYVVDLVRSTRGASSVVLGAGPRASLALGAAAQALALMDGEAFVTPDHVREIAVAVIAHRLVLDPQARYSGLTRQAIVAEVLKSVPVPR